MYVYLVPSQQKLGTKMDPKTKRTVDQLRIFVRLPIQFSDNLKIRFATEVCGRNVCTDKYRNFAV